MFNRRLLRLCQVLALIVAWQSASVRWLGVPLVEGIQRTILMETPLFAYLALAMERRLAVFFLVCGAAYTLIQRFPGYAEVIYGMSVMFCLCILILLWQPLRHNDR